MKITVVGTGYVGLVTAVCLAHWGHTVTCVESDPQKLSLLKSGQSPILEKDVEKFMWLYADRLVYTDSCHEACMDTQIVFICVGTPEREDGHANLKYVFKAAEQVADNVSSDCVCVVKSTVPIGTNRKLERLFSSKVQNRCTVEVASNPEFLSQGTAVYDFLFGPRVVIGVASAHSEGLLKSVYANYDGPIIVTDRQTAEMIKYASNNFLALKVSYINEIANLCERVGADAETVSLGMGMDSRIGKQFLRAGIGYGGSCFPKDTKALHWMAKYHDYEIKTVKAAIEVNENQKMLLFKKAHRYYPSLEGLTVAVLGITFKPDTDDLRDAPSLQNIALLLEEGAHVRVWDPSGYEALKTLFPHSLICCDTITEAISNAELCMIMTEWRQIREFAPAQYANYMKVPVVIDGRNCYSPESVKNAGIVYDSIGRPRVLPVPEPAPAGNTQATLVCRPFPAVLPVSAEHLHRY